MSQSRMRCWVCLHIHLLKLQIHLPKYKPTDKIKGLHPDATHLAGWLKICRAVHSRLEVQHCCSRHHLQQSWTIHTWWLMQQIKVNAWIILEQFVPAGWCKNTVNTSAILEQFIHGCWRSSRESNLSTHGWIPTWWLTQNSARDGQGGGGIMRLARVGGTEGDVGASQCVPLPVLPLVLRVVELGNVWQQGMMMIQSQGTCYSDVC